MTELQQQKLISVSCTGSRTLCSTTEASLNRVVVLVCPWALRRLEERSLTS